MKKPENAQQILRELYDIARRSGRVHTQKEFADLLGFNRSVLSTYMQGSAPITEQQLRRITDAAAVQGIVISESDGIVTPGSANMIAGRDQKILGADDDKWFVLVAEKDKQIDRLLGIIENMQK